MADYENRRRTGQGYRRDYGDDRYDHGHVDRDLRESRRRLEQTGDYDPEMLDDMRRFSGEDRGGYRDSRYDRDTRGYAGERYRHGGDDRATWSRSDQGRTDYGHGNTGRTERGERGMWDRASDEVSSWFGNDDAERRRDQDESRGHRGRGPRGYSRSDDRVREDVSDRLTDDPYVDASEIDVMVSGCEVTLTGTVDSRAAKRRAEDIAENVSGVRHVQNNLRVRQPSYTGSGTAGGASAMAGLGSGGSTTGMGTGTGTGTGAGTTGTDATDASGRAWTVGTDPDRKR